ncbi:50S ribosome-binding GTPase [Candidatus Woesearchaeota archaeon]|nr:50S ribosome-binding GTPase [Candidatus Woesearchaeota archaeon]MBW3014297.1 50S ribosome-binding GTPase [Candidatus Woesearchaeota archaeon]
MAKRMFWDLVNEVIARSDIVLEVLDARMIEETRNEEVERRIKSYGKQLIFVVNKCDLVPDSWLKKISKELFPVVCVESKSRKGKTQLREKILRYSEKKPMVKVGVVGYPNTGKSSVINMLKGQASAGVSSKSGFTRGIQLVKADNRIMLLDSPGVFPFEKGDEVKLAMIGTKNPQELKDPESCAMEMIVALKGKVEKNYGAKKGADEEETLENIAVKLKKLKKGGEPDTETASRIIIKDWQSGKIELKEK